LRQMLSGGSVFLGGSDTNPVASRWEPLDDGGLRLGCRILRTR
jgi:hypothetical protein